MASDRHPEKVLTVGELRRALEGEDDDTPLVFFSPSADTRVQQIKGAAPGTVHAQVDRDGHMLGDNCHYFGMMTGPFWEGDRPVYPLGHWVGVRVFVLSWWATGPMRRD